MVPLWYLSYITVITVPLCIWLIWEGDVFLIFAIGIFFYYFYSVTTVYSYFKIQFDSILIRFQNEELLLDLQKSHKKIDAVNKNLNKKIKYLFLKLITAMK